MHKIIKFSLFFIIFSFTNFVSSMDITPEELAIIKALESSQTEFDDANEALLKKVIADSLIELNNTLKNLMTYLIGEKIGTFANGTLNDQDIENIKNLVKSGADINYKCTYNRNTYTLLIISIMLKNTDLSKWLVENGANINQDVQNFFCHGSPLLYATIYNPDLIEYLIDLGANIAVLNEYNRNPLMLYIYYSLNSMQININIIKRLIKEQKKININAKEQDGNTALHMLLIISQSNDYSSPDLEETIRLLIEAGADVNIANNKGIRPSDYVLCARIWNNYKDSVLQIIHNSNPLDINVNKIILDYL